MQAGDAGDRRAVVGGAVSNRAEAGLVPNSPNFGVRLLGWVVRFVFAIPTLSVSVSLFIIDT